MKKKLLCYLSLACVTIGFSQTGFQSLDFLYSIQGEYVLSGQHNDQKNLECGLGTGPTGPDYWTEQVHDKTGKYPALWGGDFLFHGSEQLRWDMTYEAETQWNSGAVVNIMWHACPPIQGASCGWDGGLLSSMTTQQWDELLTDGSAINTTWKERVNEIATHLQYLEDAGVEVWWRPYHEQNQTAFWWNSQGPQYTQRLWRMMHDYMTNDLGLTNLVWVWDIQDLGTGYSAWDPGNAYWDILALDIYADGYTNASYYNDMVATASGKPIAIGECFQLPSAQVLDTYPQYTFFMNWAYGLKKTWGPDCYDTNTDDFIREVYNNPKVLTLDEMPGWGAQLAQNLVTGKTVNVSSTEAGNNVATHINDRNLNTRWSSEYTDNEWVEIDLEMNHELDSLRITWEAAYASAYEIQGSMDGINWEVFESINSNTDEVNFFILNGVETRYLRIECLSRATVYGYSIYEIEAFGKALTTGYNGVPNLIPGSWEAEDYDLGGEGIAYHDLTPNNQYVNYRTDNVDIEVCNDFDGGYNVGAFETGEWLNYSISNANSMMYTVELRVATTQSNATFHLELDGVDLTGEMSVSQTNGWQDWTTLAVPELYIPSGQHVLKLVSDNQYFNVNHITVTDVLTTSSSLKSTPVLGVYPNPSASGVFYLNQEVKALTVHDTFGRAIADFNQETHSLDLRDYPSGIYTLSVLESSTNLRHQFILIKE